MNEQIKSQIAYGKKLIEGKELTKSADCGIQGRTPDIRYNKWKALNGLDYDPVTGRKAHRPYMSDAVWAARNAGEIARLSENYPYVNNVRGLKKKWKAERSDEDTQPAVYVYRMRSALSGRLLDSEICKIGSAQYGADGRIVEQTKKAAVGYVPEVELVFLCNDPVAVETLLHDRFRDFRVSTLGAEWFEVTKEEIENAVKIFQNNGLLVNRNGKLDVCNTNEASRAARLIIGKILPDLEAMKDTPELAQELSSRLGIDPIHLKAGLQKVEKAGYLDRFDDGWLMPSGKFRQRLAELNESKSAQ